MRAAVRVCVAVLAACATHARAQDWDHDANIQAAVEAVAAVEQAGGGAAAEVFVADCYRSIDAAAGSEAQLVRLEYCAGMDFAGFLLSRQARSGDRATPSPFFAAQAMFERMQRIEEWVRDPTTNQQILRAWAAAAAASLAALQGN